MNKKVLVTLSVIFIVIVLALILFLNKKVVVTFDSNGGSSVEDVTVRINTTVSKPINPTKEGYTFVGWFNGNDEVKVGDIVTGNMTLKARFEKKSDEDTTNDNTVKYSITFDSDGGTIKATGEKVSPKATTGKTNVTGDAIIIEENTNYVDNIKLNITGGKLESVNGYLIQEYNPILGTQNELTSVVTGLYPIKNAIDEVTFYYTSENK